MLVLPFGGNTSMTYSALYSSHEQLQAQWGSRYSFTTLFEPFTTERCLFGSRYHKKLFLHMNLLVKCSQHRLPDQRKRTL